MDKKTNTTRTMTIKGDKFIIERVRTDIVSFSPYDYIMNYNGLKTLLNQTIAEVSKTKMDAETITPEKLLKMVNIEEKDKQIKEFQEEEKFLRKFFNKAKALHVIERKKQERAKKVKK